MHNWKIWKTKLGRDNIGENLDDVYDHYKLKTFHIMDNSCKRELSEYAGFQVTMVKIFFSCDFFL